MSKSKNAIDGAEMVLAIGPDSEQAAQMTRKAFDSVYADKGFEIVGRDNVERAEPAGRNHSGKSTRDAGRAGEKELVATGSAASIAESIGLQGEGGAKREKQSDSENEVSDERKSAGRDRGRGN